MENDKLFIPTLCKVGFQSRQDTYTGKLGYIIAFDGKKWRKEPSWKGWCIEYSSSAEDEETKIELFNKWKANYLNVSYYTYEYWLSRIFHNRKVTSDESFKPIEFSNVPTAGFTLNKDVRRDGYWGNGHNMIRVYDPRGFEFEISVINLLFILMYVDCNSRELMGEMVYAWNGKDLVLLPANTEEYQNSKVFTENLSKKVSSKDLVPGIYKTKQGETVKYLGRFTVYENDDYGKSCTIVEKQHVFVYPDERYGNKRSSWRLGRSIYQYGTVLAFLSHYISENTDHAEDVEAFLNSRFNHEVDYSKPVYEVCSNIFPVLNYGRFNFMEIDTYTRVYNEVSADKNWRNPDSFIYETIKGAIVFRDIFVRNFYDKVICTFNDSGIEVRSDGYNLFYNGIKFGSARINESFIYLYEGAYFNNRIDTIKEDPNEFIHNIVIKKLIGYETTNGKIHNV